MCTSFVPRSNTTQSFAPSEMLCLYPHNAWKVLPSKTPAPGSVVGPIDRHTLAVKRRFTCQPSTLMVRRLPVEFGKGVGSQWLVCREIPNWSRPPRIWCWGRTGIAVAIQPCRFHPGTRRLSRR